MLDREFESYLRRLDLADKTIEQRIYALKRIERAEGVDLEREFESDGLGRVLARLTYSKADQRAGAENPSNLPIDADKLLTHLAWYRSHLQSYRKFKSIELGVSLASPSAADEDQDTAELEDSVTQVFGLERDLQAALRANLTQLEPGLVAIDNGQERQVEAGFIDILARDQRGSVTVIELKAETGRPAVIAQILAYMGCIAYETGEPVRGIIVASDFDKRVELAARAAPNLALRKYRYRFEFS